MDPLKKISSKLAFQVDRKILDLDEEEHYRLDLPVSGPLNTKALFAPRFTQRSSFGQFALTAVALFIALFTLTNARSYSQIIAANVTSWLNPPVSEVIHEAIPLSGTELVSTSDGILPVPILPTTYENRIEIPSIKVNAPIVLPENGLEALKGENWNSLEVQIKESLTKGVVHYPGTAEPGKIGNVFLTGHSSNVFWERSLYNSVFALLPKLDVGADIFITYNQERFHYKVTSKTEVSPKETSILKQGDREELTLMTCTPVGTRLKRLVVKAEPVTADPAVQE